MDLDFFVHPAWRPRIRPAAPKRDWMEATPERFAYRCLPLAIANAHGWEVGSPCGFEARWNGGSGVDAVEVRVDPGAQPHQAPVSLFGQGTVTLHIEAIVRTSPGWNLWVGGPPNGAKDGLAPLGAVIETDWSPYTFTMNWRFTRPDHWVRFEEDEPFCFFFPVQRGVLDEVKPRFRALDDAAELRDAFASWSESRNAFQAWVAKTRPAAPADHWQKLYYRGVNPDGSRGAPDHQSKIRLAAPSGRDDLVCPVTRTAPRPAAALEQRGEDRTSERGDEAERALRLRDWLLTVTERQRDLSDATAGVAWVSGISSQEFLDNFYAASRPVLIDGEMAGWPALDRWTPDFLEPHVGRTGIELASLYADLGNLDAFLAGGPGTLRVEAEGTHSPLRFELANTLFAQVVGRTRLLLLPPSETPKLYNRRGAESEVGDLSDPARLKRFPLAADARAFEVTLNPGDLLFLPVGWWRQARAETIGATLTGTDFLWPNVATEAPDL